MATVAVYPTTARAVISHTARVMGTAELSNEHIAQVTNTFVVESTSGGGEVISKGFHMDALKV